MTRRVCHDDYRYIRARRSLRPGTGKRSGSRVPWHLHQSRDCRLRICFEVGFVMQGRRGYDGARDLDLLLAKLRVDIAAVTANQADIARKAFRRYGRGRHPANLNFGDCFCLCSGEGQVSPIAVQGQRFQADRCDGGIVLMGFEYLSSSRTKFKRKHVLASRRRNES
jgi:uncharacterized protein with PIN domain